MAEQGDPGVSGSELSAAFRLGFFARYVDRDVLLEVLNVLHTRIAPSMLLRLKQTVPSGLESLTDSGQENRSFGAAADRALASADPCRVLYDLGAALGDYQLKQVTGVRTPDAAPVWACVQRIPDCLVRLSRCLYDLAEEAKAKQNLESVIARINEPWAQMLATDDDDEYRTNFRRILSQASPWVQRAAAANRPISVLMIVSELTRELADAYLTSEGTTPPNEAFIPTNLQAAILKALTNRNLTKQPLALEVCCGEGSRLYKPGGIKELKERGMVKNKRGVGYYRPDAPPPAP